MGPSSHLNLLREEHLELLNKYGDLQQKYAALQSKIDPDQVPDSTTLGGQLCATMKNLYENHAFSDVTIRVDGRELKCHKFLLVARSNHWKDLDSADFIDIPDASFKAFEVVYRWMYTDSLPHSQFDIALLQEVCQIAFRFHFSGLQIRCVQLLKIRVDVKNCISLFEFADLEGIVEVRDYCCAIIAAHWTEFKPQQFSHLSAPALFRLLKKNSPHVLHSIVQLNREDVLLLYFIENDSKVHTVVNAVDEKGLSALEIALTSDLVNIASQLVKKGADCNLTDDSGRSILMRMIEKGDVTACEFLASAGADLNFVQRDTDFTPLHYIACSVLNQVNMAEWAGSRLKEMNINAVDVQGRTALLLSVLVGNVAFTRVLLKHGADVLKADSEGKSPLSAALFDRNDTELSTEIVNCGGVTAVNHCIDGVSLLHIAVQNDEIENVRFLLENNAAINAVNSKDETPLEVAVRQSNVSLVSLLLDKGASVRMPSSGQNSILHRAILCGPEMLTIFAKKAKDVDWTIHGLLNYALDEGLRNCAKILVTAGASIEEKDKLGNTLLVQRILMSDDSGAVFLLENGAKHLVKDSKGRTCLEMSAFYGLVNTLRTICGLGVNINERTNGGRGYTVLQQALSEGRYDCASLLVSLGCDLESSTVDGSFVQTMLHHFIDVGDERAAVFLVDSGCDCNAVRIPREADPEKEESPIHRAISSNMVALITSLVKAKANLAVQDSQGRTACHLAVDQRNAEALLELLKASDVEFLSLRDKMGQTPFSQALFSKEHALAAAIVKRQPHVALQTNGNGENLLHTSVKLNDLESVLFLLSAHTDATRLTADGSRRSALHYAANVDNELILRNLLLAGCEVDEIASDGTTPLQIAARNNRSLHAEILLENNANPNIVDERRENALLAAVRSGSVDCVNVFARNLNIDSLAVNKNGQSALHLCATLSSDKLPPRRSAVEICEILLKREAHRLSEKDFAAYVDMQDADGNTALLLAYMAGNGDICRCLLRYGATMGARNADGATMFTYETPTRLLLFRLLDSLEREPRWSDGDMCDCGVRFSITVRKHHCRHCGRLVCSKCSEVTMPIAKYGEEKRVRVCSLCAEVLTTGTAR
ncbi:FYVE zinc finger [Trichostrongylus colubriformis]|uniref:FYVE zinc finger n=1 Tax=Trichostrongylus colubriformis TaxID=6319 RepID=A0AAN8G0M8_TRICO